MKNKELPEGEVLLLYLKDSASSALQSGVALARPRFENRFDDTFLVGFVPENERDWASGLEAAVRWSEVQHYLVFETKAEYLARVESAPVPWEIPRGPHEVS